MILFDYSLTLEEYKQLYPKINRPCFLIKSGDELSYDPLINEESQTTEHVLKRIKEINRTRSLTNDSDYSVFRLMLTSTNIRCSICRQDMFWMPLASQQGFYTRPAEEFVKGWISYIKNDKNYHELKTRLTKVVEPSTNVIYKDHELMLRYTDKISSWNTAKEKVYYYVIRNVVNNMALLQKTQTLKQHNQNDPFDSFFAEILSKQSLLNIFTVNASDPEGFDHWLVNIQHQYFMEQAKQLGITVITKDTRQ